MYNQKVINRIVTYLPYTFPYTFEYRLIPNCTRIIALGVVHNNIIVGSYLVRADKQSSVLAKLFLTTYSHSGQLSQLKRLKPSFLCFHALSCYSTTPCRRQTHWFSGTRIMAALYEGIHYFSAVYKSLLPRLLLFSHI